MSERYLVTSALPYANGSIHLGHMVEHVQTDVYVRFRRSTGDQVTWICAADAHGTPIEVNAAKAAMSPKEFSEKYRKEHHEDFIRFGISHDTYYTTDSPENERWAYRFYDALKAKGLIYKKSVEQLYCETDKRFLPDRFVKGTCPRCGTPDQYGDVCENCGTTYDPRELKNPYCSICRSKPILRTSDHAYVDLKKVAPQIKAWVDAEGHLEAPVREQVRGWLADLQDWCITRDAPYFGFPVKDPEFAGKFLYVWLDAPIGYLSSAEHYFTQEAKERISAEEMEKTYLVPNAPSRLEHFIGKDILRFHAVFWPAMMAAVGFKTPDRIPVHGHLTLNGQKMSKARGTFVTARTYLDSGLDPQLLRYYYAANLGPNVTDLDLSMEEFRNRINADLANNVANLASRVFALVQKVGKPLTGPSDERVVEATRSALHLAQGAYAALELKEVVRMVNQVADVCNKRHQEAKPWESLDSAGSQGLLFTEAKSLRAIATMLWPIMPLFSDGLARAFGQARPGVWAKDFDPFAGPPVEAKEAPPKIARLELSQVEKLIQLPGDEAKKPAGDAKVAKPGAEKKAPVAAAKAAPATPGVITYDDFAKLELKVGLVLAVEPVPKADKLLKLSVELGEAAPRTLVAGIAQAYPDVTTLVGKRIVVVANLEPKELRKIVSHGMLLAAGEPPNLTVVTVGDTIAPGTRVK